MQSSNRPVDRPWALVTGASSGIGAALAREFARHGHDLVLSARRVAPMEALAGELRGLGATATIIPANLTEPGAAAALLREIDAAGVEIEVLVNNAGLGAIGPFAQIDPVRDAEIMQVNVVALTELTRLLLPQMLTRKHGKIVLVASTASFLPCPNMAVYAASKAYVRSFGEALAQEVAGSGVNVNVLCPGATETEFLQVAGGRFSRSQMRRIMGADEVARIGYRGMARGERVTITGVTNRVLTFAATHAPHSLTLPIAERTIRRD